MVLCISAYAGGATALPSCGRGHYAEEKDIKKTPAKAKQSADYDYVQGCDTQASK